MSLFLSKNIGLISISERHNVFPCLANFSKQLTGRNTLSSTSTIIARLPHLFKKESSDKYKCTTNFYYYLPMKSQCLRRSTQTLTLEVGVGARTHLSFIRLGVRGQQPEPLVSPIKKILLMKPC